VARNIKPLLFVTFFLVVSASLGFWFWRQAVITKRSKLSSAAIQSGLAAGDFVSARSALAGIPDPVVREDLEEDIRVAELEKAISIRDISVIRMSVADERAATLDPKLLESADLKLARDALQNRDLKAYDSFATKWKGKSAFSGQWVLMEADALIARKSPEEAYKLLKSATLTGTEDAQRYVRLALLEANEPWKAMAQLDEGLKSDPRNADILAFRAQIQEAAGRLDDARLDYVAAVLCERKNPLYRDILASFYIRTFDLAGAAETWRDAAEDTDLGVYSLKSWFWSRISGFRLSKPIPPCRQATWTDFIATVIETPDEVFWNPALEGTLSSVRGGNTRPEVAWLRVLESLRSKDFGTARKNLETGFSNEAENLAPSLSIQIMAHLTAREGKNPRLALAGRDLPAPDAKSHPFVLQFAQWANRSLSAEDDQKFEVWLAQPNALVGILFSANWAGAGVMIGEGDKLTLSPDAPDWFDYGYAKSLQMRDGKEAPRKWLSALPKRSSASNLLLGELLLTSGSVNEGLGLLETIAKENSPLSSRAAWTLALTELDRGQSAKAREIVLATPTLAENTQGREILARAALAEGSRAETIRIYQELGESSADAMIFMSKEAFAAGDLDQAEKWTTILARRFPEQPDFRKNLIKIYEAQNLKKP
jgi:Tfp pilus assembly protein PilF